MKSVRVMSLAALMSLAVAGCTDLTSSSAPVQTPAGGTMPMQNTNTTLQAATSSSTTIGGVLGGNVGKSMDDMDQVKVNQLLETSKTNQTSNWTNTATHTTFAATPTRTFTSPTGEPCRDFTVTAVNNGQPETVYGTACRDGNGQWHVISS